MDPNNGKAERLLNHSRVLRSDMQNLMDDVAEVGRDIRRKTDFSEAIQKHPIRSVCIAAGVGYLLGGGLFSPLTGRLLKVGGRAMLLPILRNQFESMVAGASTHARD